MGEWVDGEVDDGWMGGSMDGWVSGWVCGWMGTWMGEWLAEGVFQLKQFFSCMILWFSSLYPKEEKSPCLQTASSRADS